MSATYACEQCGGTFTDTWTEEEALAEAATLWTNEERERSGMARVCEDCFNEIMERLGRSAALANGA
ncbi:hypothetical protein LCGC14_1995980 [marine sediment metagenome]|uniref:Uncharacterized protein n=1 Tax=marine sediment metagenome TaxID=412755 RepID=A0A0F9I1T0_9ZZZZ